MLDVTIETVADVAVIRCAGRIVRSDAAYLFAEAVVSQIGARAVVLDLTAVEAIEVGGLGMLVFLQRLTSDYGTPFKFFNPTRKGREKLRRVISNLEVDIASIPSVVALTAGEQNQPNSLYR